YDDTQNASDAADINIITGMGSARNETNALSRHILAVIGMAAGTASEVALAIKANTKIILLRQDEITIRFFKNIGTYKSLVANTIEDTIQIIRDYLKVKPAAAAKTRIASRSAEADS